MTTRSTTRVKQFSAGLITALGITLSLGASPANAAPLNDYVLNTGLSCNKTNNTYAFKPSGVDFDRNSEIVVEWTVGETYPDDSSFGYAGGTTVHSSSSGSWSAPTEYGSPGTSSGTVKITVVAYTPGSLRTTKKSTCTW